ncbi:MAG: hypothetical protein HGA71_08365 [Azonexaceae bacterium]|nr:hypothetical protein [Azonexaceae bacterium]
MSRPPPPSLEELVTHALITAEHILGRLDRADDHPAAAVLKEKAIGIASDGEATEKVLSDLEMLTDQLRNEGWLRCVANEGFEEVLMVGEVYRRQTCTAGPKFVRIDNEDGGWTYPAKLFVAL